MSKTYKKSSVRFLFAFILFFSNSVFAETNLKEFTDEHFYPTVERASGLKAKAIWRYGLVLAALGYSQTYEISEATEEQILSGEMVGNGALSIGLIGLQLAFDHRKYNAYSHLRGLVYTAGFVYGSKAILMGRWPGENIKYQSFPSTHTAVSFLSATSLTYAYGWKAAILAYPAAAFVGYSKLGNESSRLSDVIVGATIGIWMGRASYYEDSDRAKDLRLQKNPKFTTSLDILPVLSHDQYGATVYYTF
jgi:membrane-associated phospholipid phosphatase